MPIAALVVMSAVWAALFLGIRESERLEAMLLRRARNRGEMRRLKRVQRP